MRTHFAIAIAVAVVLLIGCNAINDPASPAPAVQGVVFDAASQQPVAGARIEIAGRIATTNANGQYYVAGVPNGAQALTASKDGYATYITDVRVTSDVNEKKLHLQPLS